MIAVAGHWELGWNTPIKEIDLWKFMIRDFGVDKFYMFPVSGIINKNVIEKHNLNEIIEDCEDYEIVIIDERSTVELSSFKHPKNALYISGIANDKSLDLNVKSVKIETVENKGLLWPHQAISIILYDRLKKNKKLNNNGINSN